MCASNTNRSAGCPQGNVPVYAVDVHEIKDIQVAVQFAAQHRLRLVIRNTGHDFLGRSTATGAFSIWTHHLDEIKTHDDFVSDQCAHATPEHAVTVQAGVHWESVYSALGDNRAIVGGASFTVGAAGGYVGGGGHSALSPRFGMAVDNALQFTVVTAKGDVVVANECQNADLFWALRGGGSSYGVIYDVTYRTYPQAPTVFAFLYVTAADTALEAIVRRWNEIQIKLADQGYSGYFEVFTTGFSYQFYLFDHSDITSANQTLSSFIEFAQKQSGGKTIHSMQAFSSYYQAQLALVHCDPTKTDMCPPTSRTDTGGVMASRLIPHTLFEEEHVQDFSDVFWNVTRTLTDELKSAMLGHLVAGGRVAEIEADSVGLNPAWRKALIHYVLPAGWDTNASVDLQRQVRQKTMAITRKLVDITPDSGAYINEASSEEPNWKHSFYGDHYGKLLSIKKQWDRHSLFVCRQCVDSDLFEDENLTCPKQSSY